MTKLRAAITGVQGYVPDYILTNKELEKLVDTTDEWIMTRTGISQRHILKGEGLGVSDMAVEAVKGLLAKTNTKAEDVEVVIFCTVTPDMVFPASANILCDKVGMKNAWGFDLGAACSGFLYGLTTGTRLIESGAHRTCYCFCFKRNIC
jgi:3-oxoacyl-[acyl-carrier-protein] synthase-3